MVSNQTFYFFHFKYTTVVRCNRAVQLCATSYWKIVQANSLPNSIDSLKYRIWFSLQINFFCIYDINKKNCIKFLFFCPFWVIRCTSVLMNWLCLSVSVSKSQFQTKLSLHFKNEWCKHSSINICVCVSLSLSQPSFICRLSVCIYEL